MEFSEDEIINNEGPLCWNQLINTLRENSIIKGWNKADNRDQWIFRALGKWDVEKKENYYYKHVPSSFDEACERPSEKMDPEKRWLYESWMLYEFKREAYNYLPNLPEPDDFLSWWALARHFEMPTRLVDFSYSFYIAAYFALSNRMGQDAGCILAINLTWMKKKIEEKLKGEWSTWLRGKAIPDHQASFHNKKLFQQFVFDFRTLDDYKKVENCVVPVNPLKRNPRLAKQHGLFLCPSNIEKDFNENLRKTLNGQQDVKRLIYLPWNLSSEAIRDLRDMNISIATLYPELSGWAQSQRDLVHLNIPNDDYHRFIQELKINITNPRF